MITHQFIFVLEHGNWNELLLGCVSHLKSIPVLLFIVDKAITLSAGNGANLENILICRTLRTSAL